MKSLFKITAIVWKDILSEARTRDVITSVLIFALLVIIIFNFAFEMRSDMVDLVAPGILWVAFTFAGVLALNRSFVMEHDRGCIEGLMLCPVDRDVIYLGKMLASLIFMLLVEAVVLFIFSIFFDLPLLMPRLWLITGLSTVGFASVGTLFSAISVNTKARDIMLPILFFPVVSPVIIAAVKATGLVLLGEPWSAMSSWLQIMVAFDVIFLIVSVLVFEFVIEQ